MVFWAPFQVAGSVGMLLGERWGFLLALIASVPFWYSAIPIYIGIATWGSATGTLTYWVFVGNVSRSASSRWPTA